MVDYPAEVVSEALVSVGEDCISELVVRDERERVSPLPCHVTIEFEERPVLERLEPTCLQGPASGRESIVPSKPVSESLFGQ